MAVFRPRVLLVRCHLSSCDVVQHAYHLGYTVCEPAACMCAGILSKCLPDLVGCGHATPGGSATPTAPHQGNPVQHRMFTASTSGVAPAQTIGVALAVDSHVSFTHAALQCRHGSVGCYDAAGGPSTRPGSATKRSFDNSKRYVPMPTHITLHGLHSTRCGALPLHAA